MMNACSVKSHWAKVRPSSFSFLNLIWYGLHRFHFKLFTVKMIQWIIENTILPFSEELKSSLDEALDILLNKESSYTLPITSKM